MKPVLKEENAQLLTEDILQRLAQDLPMETITNPKTVKHKPFSWIGKMVATFTLIFLSITAVKKGNVEYTSIVNWNPQSTHPIAESLQKETSSAAEFQELVADKRSTHPEIMVAHLEYNQPIKEGPVVFEAVESITLKPGFKVEAGVTFTAAIVNNQGLSLE